MNIGLGHFDVPALCTRRSDLLDALISALPAAVFVSATISDIWSGNIKRRNSLL